MLKHNTKTGELYVEAVAVTEFARGKGIGTKLFAPLIKFAKNKGYSCITLQVIDTNPRAKELYEKVGFSVIKKSRIWPVNKLVGWPFNVVFLMKKSISE